MKAESIFLLLFGAVTVFMSSSVLFDWFGIRAREGHFVPIVVWANFFCGILYITAAAGLIKKRTCAPTPLLAALVILAGAFTGLYVHLRNGGLYETKTIGALVFRTAVTLLLFFITLKNIRK